jgi:anti-sigma28 factor (negative regulator of flagellin synthesis)
MRVDDRHLTGTQAAESGRTSNTPAIERAGDSRNSESRPAAAAADRVELSGLTGGLGRALQAAASERTARVEKLSRQYALGNYDVDSKALSRAMASQMRAAADRPARTEKPDAGSP